MVFFLKKLKFLLFINSERNMSFVLVLLIKFSLPIDFGLIRHMQGEDVVFGENKIVGLLDYGEEC